MAKHRNNRAGWESAFLARLRAGDSVADASRAADVHPSTPYNRRNNNAEFARAFSDARAACPAPQRPLKEPRHNPHWKDEFITHLAETSNVSAAAAMAKTSAQTAYAARREDKAFAERWLAALVEGYEHLEMEVLGYLRDPDPKRKMDVANALRLLAAHRETVAKERAFREEEDEQAVLESIDAFIEDMRQRRLANEAILAQRKPESDHVA
ncbi:MAG: hypothetical protein H6918_02100 [Sphingomonadaceae bacterium]|nr:hypothetical protein [Sphingomonadaceae bacterium]